MNTQKVDHRWLLICGFFALIVAMGVGRFAYTPLLPGMQALFGFSDELAGTIASVNYVGSLLGALLCLKKMGANARLFLFRIFLAASVITTVWMGGATRINWWIILRFVSGVASAGIFVTGSAIVMERLGQSKQAHHGVLMYSGVGVGIALTGVASPLFLRYFDVQTGWVGLGLLCVPMALLCCFFMIPPPDTLKADSDAQVPSRFEYPGLFPWLVAAYFCEGFGYIINGTFIVSFLQGGAGFFSSGPIAWTMIGLTASVSIIVFQQLTKRFHVVHLFVIAHFIQGVGIILPVLSFHWISINLGAILYGVTFMGITALSLSVGKILKPGQSQMVIGLLTAIYGVGQILGPLVSGLISGNTGSFVWPLALSAMVVVLGGAILIAGLFCCKHQLPT